MPPPSKPRRLRMKNEQMNVYLDSKHRRLALALKRFFDRTLGEVVADALDWRVHLLTPHDRKVVQQLEQTVELPARRRRRRGASA